MKILVVDDEEDVQVLFEQLFRREIKDGVLEFVFARSGEEAMEFMQTYQQRPLIILSDINMPGMSGLDLLKRIKKDYEKPPMVVMMVSAYGDEENFNAAKQYGADDFLTKPVDFGVLKNKLKIQMV